ncbi:hypothetical protein BGX26_010296 [Mortierella sp. AD094]|nr:hypothetical protein BGX26_010296 [Mortierella sp. AD094]
MSSNNHSPIANANASLLLQQYNDSTDGEGQGRPNTEEKVQEQQQQQQQQHQPHQIDKEIGRGDDEEEEEEEKEIEAMVSTEEQATQQKQSLAHFQYSNKMSQDVAVQETFVKDANRPSSVDDEKGNYESYDLSEEEPGFRLQQRSHNEMRQDEHTRDRTYDLREHKELEIANGQSLDDKHLQERQQQKSGKIQISTSNGGRIGGRGASDYLIKLWTSRTKQPRYPSSSEPGIGKGEGSTVNKKGASSEDKEIKASNALNRSSKHTWISTNRKGLRSTRDAVEINNNYSFCCLDIADTSFQTPNISTISSSFHHHSPPSSPSPSSPRCQHETKKIDVSPNIPNHNYNTTEPSTTQTTRPNNRMSKSSYNTFDTSNSRRFSSNSSYRNSGGFLLGQEKARTWRGLFSSVRQLSHSASTTGSSHSVPSSSATCISSTEERVCPRKNRRTRHKSRKTIPILTSIEEKQMSEKSEPIRLSIVVVGDGAVGKSALTLRFLRDQFHDEYDPTIEDSYCRHIEVDGQEYTLDINDTAGQQEYRGHWNDQFLRSGDGFICVYSVASMSSFQELVGFRDQIWRAKESTQIPMIMVGNKWDLANQGVREVPTDLGAHFSEHSKALFVEASAKIGTNINEMFIALVREIVRQKKRASYGYKDIDVASRSSSSANAPRVSITGYSKNATPPAPIGGNRDRDVQKSYRCCTIM